MPEKLIADLGGLRLEVEVREWDDSLFRAVYTIDGHYVASLRCIRTKACPEGMITIRAAPLSASCIRFAAAFATLLAQAVRDADQMATNGGPWQPGLSAMPCGGTVQ
jgi:hypothetical protein